MRTLQRLKSAAKRRGSDERGFTLVEMVIAIPVTLLMLGLVFASVGVTVGLMGQVTKGAGAARIATQAFDNFTDSRSCGELRSKMASEAARAAERGFELEFGEYSCSSEVSFSLPLEVKEPGTGKTNFSKTVTLAAM